MPGKRSNRWIKWTIFGVIGVAVVAAAIGFWRRDQKDGPQYETATVKRGDLTQLVTATGTLNPVDDPLAGNLNVTVGSQVSGLIIKIFADYNSVVKSNEVIAEIDPSTYAAQLNQAQANLAYAKANLELQQVEVARDFQLYTNKLLDASDYDTAVATRDEAAAQVQIQEATVTNAVANLGYCKIRSPVDGVVIARDVDVGQTVASSFTTPTLFQIANNLTKMQIDSNVAEGDIGGVQEGQEATFNVDAYPYRTFYGTVTQVRNSPITVNNVVTYDCVIGVDNYDYKLKPGMTANPLNIIIAQRHDVLEIPNSALRFRPAEGTFTAASTNNATNTNNFARQGFGGGTNRFGGFGGRQKAQATVHTVYVISGKGENATSKAVQIKTGISDGVFTEALSGLEEDDRVVTGLAFGDASAGQGRNLFAPRFR